MSNLGKAHEHIRIALDRLPSINDIDAFTLADTLTNAIVAAAYTNLAILDYVRDRDNYLLREEKSNNDNSDNVGDSVRDMEGRDSKP